MATATKESKASKAKAQPANKATRKVETADNGREILHPEIRCEFYLGNDAMTVEKMKELIGWTVQPEGEDWGDDYFIKNTQGQKVRCTHNSRNRPFKKVASEKYGQDALNLNWADSRNTRDTDTEPVSHNGQTLVINRYGDVDSGQHQLTGWILASETFDSDTIQGRHFRELWAKSGRDSFTIEAIVIYGISGNPRVTRTIDNMVERTLADVAYTHREMFGKVTKDEAQKYARMLEYAVRTLWDRTGAKLDAYASELTHSEAMGFIDRHPRLLEAVKFIAEEDGETKKLTKLRVVPPGTFSGLFYLMACSGTDPQKYRPVDAKGVPTIPAEEFYESNLDFGNWEAARGFTIDWLKGTADFEGVRKALHDLQFDDPNDANSVRDKVSQAEKTAVIVDAWNIYLQVYTECEGDSARIKRVLYKRLTAEACRPKITNKLLTYVPNVGGIDIGDPEQHEVERKARTEGATKEEKEANKKLEIQTAKLNALKEARDKVNAPEAIILSKVIKEDKTTYVAYHDDAEAVALASGNIAKEEASSGLMKTVFSEEKLQMVVDKLGMSKFNKTVAVISLGENGETNAEIVSVSPDEPNEESKPTPTPATGSKGKAKASASK